LAGSRIAQSAARSHPAGEVIAASGQPDTCVMMDHMDRDTLQGGDGPIDESVRGVPALALRPFIAAYAGYRQAGVAPATHRGLPTPSLPVIFTSDDPLNIAAHVDPRQPPGSYPSLVGGLHTSPALITHEGRQSGIQLALRPLGARALLGMPAAELAGTDVEGCDVLGPLASEISERIRAAGDWPGRFAVLDQMLAARLGRAPAHRAEASREVRHAWSRLVTSGGTCGIAELAADTGWSDRHLRSVFRGETGLTPKAAARVVRFDRARRLLQRRAAAGAMPLLADLAAECGYYDQAHLAREFRDLAGVSPSGWLAAEFRNVQAQRAAVLPGLPS
jgi:AraC-like DNA-binding protein